MWENQRWSRGAVADTAKKGAPIEALSRPSSHRVGGAPASGRQPGATLMGRARAATARTLRQVGVAVAGQQDGLEEYQGGVPD